MLLSGSNRQCAAALICARHISTFRSPFLSLLVGSFIVYDAVHHHHTLLVLSVILLLDLCYSDMWRICCRLTAFFLEINHYISTVMPLAESL